MLQYIVDDIRFPNVEADCLYAGIMIDTQNFMNRTGVRTFEAAAFSEKMRSGHYAGAQDVPGRYGVLPGKSGSGTNGGSIPERVCDRRVSERY